MTTKTEQYDNPGFEVEDGRKDVEEGANHSKASTFFPITYSWLDVNVYADQGGGLCGRNKKKITTKHILKNVSGICRPGELLAIMGASGAGKTTLLNVLTGREGDLLRITGRLYVNGEAIRPQQLTSRSAYVQQDDLFIGTLTVKEQLIFQARLRMDRDILDCDRMERVLEVIQELGLMKCQNTLIGIEGRIKGISGGEMKRLAFACEVLTDPPVMFCDEPTTGLDSFMAQTIVEAMQRMSLRGRTVISTIHQPSSEVFALFDRVLLMAEGRVAFLGLISDARKFFGRSGEVCPKNFNPADFYISILAVHPEHETDSRAYIQELCDVYEAQDGVAVRDCAEANSTGCSGRSLLDDSQGSTSQYKASWLSQFSAVLVRCVLQIVREPTQLRSKIILSITSSLLLGLIYFGQTLDQDGLQNLNSALFMLLTNMTFQNVFGVVNIFCADMAVLKREHDNGMYRTDVYFLAKNVADFPLAVLPSVVYVCVMYYMVGLNPGVDNFFICIAILVLVANVGVSFGYLISCMSRTVEMALAMSAPFIVPFMLFGGYFLNTDSVPVYFIWLQYISWFNYGNEALCINQWTDIHSIACNPNTTTFPCQNNGTDVLNALNFESSNFGLDVGLLFTLLVGYRLLAFVFLYVKLYRKKT